jgi:nucleotide-binding universal stress UspA family protein
MEIIVATIGLSLGVLNQPMYSIIVMVAIVTSLMAPPLLRWTLSKVEIGEEEALRLQQEEQASRSFVKNIHRVLMPTRGGPNVQLAAQLVSHMAHQNEMEVTALFALSDKKPHAGAANAATYKGTTAEEAIQAVTQEMQLPSGNTLQTKVEYGRSKAEVILKEARKGYDLIVMGATRQQQPTSALFNLLVDRVVQDAPCATMVVKSNLPMPEGKDAIAYQEIHHILVPTSGTEHSQNAVEVASTIAAHTGAMVTLVYVVNLRQVDYLLFDVQQSVSPVTDIAQQIVEQQADIGRNLGAKVDVQILKGTRPETEILNFAAKHVDLIVLGSSIRMVTGRVFFGHGVDRILNKANCPVAIVSSP